MRALLFLLFLQPVLAAPNPEAADIASLKAVMHLFEAEIVRLKPYLSSTTAFQSPNARTEIKSALESLEKRVSAQQAADKIKSPGFKITLSLFADHLKKTKQVFERGDFEYARIRLNATTNFCASCHTQVPAPKEGLTGWGKNSKASTLGDTEFLFITRRFDAALESYDDLVRKYPKSGLKEEQLMDVYRRKLALFARVKRDPDAAIQNLKQDLENKEIPRNVKLQVQSWITNFEKWKSEKTDPTQLETAQFLSYIKSALPEQTFRKTTPNSNEIVNYLRLSGLLYERLVKEADGPNTQEYLYDLAICEKHISPLYWYSLSDVYLFQCVLNYPQKPFTKKCFEAYENNMNERYNGQLPDDVRATLSSLKKNL